MSYPSTAFGPKQELDEGRLEFDPALKAFDNAFRIKAPFWQKESDQVYIKELTLKMIAHILQCLEGSDFKERLVMRGSATMSYFVGTKARTPGDLDFVVVPQNISVKAGHIERLAVFLHENPHPEIPYVGEPSISEIWTYDRVPGQRIVLHWGNERCDWGSTQLDFVFNEHLHQEPIEVPNRLLRVASPELALAWKLVWLASDMYPQVKDLFDAVLLAESGAVNPNLIRTVLATNSEVDRRLHLNTDTTME